MSDSRARMWFALFVLAVFVFGGAAGFVAGGCFPRYASRCRGPQDRPMVPARTASVAGALVRGPDLDASAADPAVRRSHRNSSNA